MMNMNRLSIIGFIGYWFFFFNVVFGIFFLWCIFFWNLVFFLFVSFFEVVIFGIWDVII